MLNNKQFKLLLEDIQSKKEIEVLLKKYNIENYVFNNDGSIDVDGDVNLMNKGLTKLPFKFGEVSGKFNCSHNLLTNLIGAPKKVIGNFWCSFNQLTNLKDAPKIVKGWFSCCGNPLVSLDGAPEILLGAFYIYENEWKHLNPFKEPEKEATLDDITDTYGENKTINIKHYLYENNRLQR